MNAISYFCLRRPSLNQFHLGIYLIVGGAYLAFAFGGSAQEAAADQFKVIENYRIAQKQSTPSKVSDLDECIRICHENNLCKSFNYNKPSHTCSIAPEAGLLSFEPSVTSGIPVEAAVPAVSQAPFYLDCAENQFPVDEPALIKESVTLDACSVGCSDEESCVAFGYDAQRKKCGYYATLTGTKPMEASLLGIKHQIDVGVRHDEKECTEYYAEKAHQGASGEVDEKNIVVVYQRCVFTTFKTKLIHTTSADPNLAHSAAAECEKLLEPLHRVVTARTGNPAFADRMLHEIRMTAMRNLSIGLMASYFEQSTAQSHQKP
jgi:hypothetical protein